MEDQCFDYFHFLIEAYFFNFRHNLRISINKIMIRNFCIFSITPLCGSSLILDGPRPPLTGRSTWRTAVCCAHVAVLPACVFSDRCVWRRVSPLHICCVRWGACALRHQPRSIANRWSLIDAIITPHTLCFVGSATSLSTSLREELFFLSQYFSEVHNTLLN